MKRWYNRKPETMQDWLLLFAVAAALLAAVWYLPAIAAALRVLLGLATPFAGGLALAYVLDIPARWFAIHLFGGRRGPGILLAYLALLAQLRHWWGWLYRSWCKAWAALPRLCPATWKTRRRCWSWCRRTMGWIPPA